MRQHIIKLVSASIDKLRLESGLNIPKVTSIQIERTRDNKHGEFASNIAMTLTKAAGMKPRDLASKIVLHMPDSPFIEKVEIAGPGFINFFLTGTAHLQVINDIHEKKTNYGRSDLGKQQSILVEFVSTNPTGPLHVGHGRGAAYGASVANLLEVAGYKVSKEYYVNDAGRQMDILAISVFLRYLGLCGASIPFPLKAYQGDYIQVISEQLFKKHKNALNIDLDDDTRQSWQQADDESKLDLIIDFAKTKLGEKNYRVFHSAALKDILKDIKEDLEEFGIHFDNWFSEQALVDSNQINDCIKRMQATGEIYEKEGALWFRSSHYGDEKDRVVVRENGQITYFASDIAYHINKYDRGFDTVINVWGADHHGYISRVKAALQASGKDPKNLEILLVQFAVLFRGKEKVSMSTRSADYVTLRDLRTEVGNDAARFFYVTRKSDQHLDFDLELAKSTSNDNPVYYIQYAHARVSSVMRQMQGKGLEFDFEQAINHFHLLVEEHEMTLLRTLARYPEIIESAAEKYEPHQICYYLRNLANDFHSYYNSHQFIIDDKGLRLARIGLILATQQVIKNGLSIIGVSAPDTM